MTTRRFGTWTPAAILAVVLSMSGCGIKNLPTAPSTGETPSVVVDENRNGQTDVLGTGDGTLAGSNTGSPVATPRIAGIDEDNTVSAAEVTRNRKASKRSFFLDPLLN